MTNKQLISKAITFISETWEDEALNLEKIAEAAGFSVSYFDKMFAEQTGKTAMEFVRVYKMTKAAVALRTSGKSVLDIALMLGYSNPENFTRAFKAIYGCAPREYREHSVSMQWKDTSTGTVIKRFEDAFPALERVGSDEFIDYLLVTDPIRYAFRIIFTPTIDHAVYKLSESHEYILVEEYRPEDTALSLLCKSENINKYISMARAFPRYCIEFFADPDFTPPEDNYGFMDARSCTSSNYVFAGDSIEPRVLEGYSVRELTGEDAKLMESFAKGRNETPGRVFTQKFNHGNFTEVQPTGLFFQEAIVGCALHCFESGRSVRYSEVGGLWFDPAHDRKECAALLHAFCLDAGLKEGYVPMLLNESDSDGWLNGAMAEEMGYRLESKRYCYDNF